MFTRHIFKYINNCIFSHTLNNTFIPRTPKDFASASDKIWPHFAALGLSRTPRWELVEKSVIKKVPG